MLRAAAPPLLVALLAAGTHASNLEFRVENGLPSCVVSPTVLADGQVALNSTCPSVREVELQAKVASMEATLASLLAAHTELAQTVAPMISPPPPPRHPPSPPPSPPTPPAPPPLGSSQLAAAPSCLDVTVPGPAWLQIAGNTFQAICDGLGWTMLFANGMGGTAPQSNWPTTGSNWWSTGDGLSSEAFTWMDHTSSSHNLYSSYLHTAMKDVPFTKLKVKFSHSGSAEQWYLNALAAESSLGDGQYGSKTQSSEYRFTFGTSTPWTSKYATQDPLTKCETSYWVDPDGGSNKVQMTYEEDCDNEVAAGTYSHAPMKHFGWGWARSQSDMGNGDITCVLCREVDEAYNDHEFTGIGITEGGAQHGCHYAGRDTYGWTTCPGIGAATGSTHGSCISSNRQFPVASGHGYGGGNFNCLNTAWIQ